MNMRRDLFGAVVLQNGNMDLLNDHHHKNRIWAKQYGNWNNKHDFECMKHYAPLLHLQQPIKYDSYPTTLIVASRKDDHVPIVHSLKYLAHRREKAKNTQFQIEKPTLLKIINSGGHNYRAASKTEYIDTVFVKLKFLAEAIELKMDKKYVTKQICKSFVEIINCWFPEPEPEIQYQIIEQRGPKVVTLHKEKVNRMMMIINLLFF